MEESEKRRERLRAMRMEAAQAEASSNAESLPGPGSLSNPLLGDSATQPEQQQSYATPRFDFYTDPMSAFSSIKKWGQHDNTHPHDSTSTMARPALCSPGTLLLWWVCYCRGVILGSTYHVCNLLLEPLCALN